MAKKTRMTLGKEHAVPLAFLLRYPPAVRKEMIREWFAKNDPESTRLMFEIRDYFLTHLMVDLGREINDAWWKLQEIELAQLRKEGKL